MIESIDDAVEALESYSCFGSTSVGTDFDSGTAHVLIHL